MKYDKNFETVMDYVFKSEGGFSDSKNDLGGRTDKGVTQTTYNAWRRKKGLSPKDVKGISTDEAKQLYYEEFWLPTGASSVKDLREGYLLFDMALNSGPYEAKKLYNKSNGNIYKFLKERKDFYDNLIQRKHEQEKHREGWYNRLKDKGYYTPPYQNEETPYDSNFGNPNLNSDFSDYSQEELQNIRNKYLYFKNKSGHMTGPAADIWHIFTPEEIGKMTPEEFSKNEALIMAQVKTGKIVENSSRFNTPGISSSPNTVLYTREDIGNMTTKEYTKHEDAIKQQMKTIGIPYNREVPKGTRTYGKEKSSRNNSSSSEDGKWVTINGNHVFIED